MLRLKEGRARMGAREEKQVWPELGGKTGGWQREGGWAGARLSVCRWANIGGAVRWKGTLFYLAPENETKAKKKTPQENRCWHHLGKSFLSMKSWCGQNGHPWRSVKLRLADWWSGLRGKTTPVLGEACTRQMFSNLQCVFQSGRGLMPFINCSGLSA